LLLLSNEIRRFLGKFDEFDTEFIEFGGNSSNLEKNRRFWWKIVDFGENSSNLV